MQSPKRYLADRCSSARVQGIEKDLGMTGTDFNVAISVLFVGYILGQIPSNLILSRVRPSLYLAGFVALWGAVSTATAASQNFTHLVVTRFFLGTSGTLSGAAAAVATSADI